ncbi:hypothetical protein EVAR_33515_1 [Eumeta japonica]|uniref:Uncharacterized protein n=1 Tax=Eumeta variegata TaxID=151549 RepID=A0A4C1VKE6_EUMVA|nr:hypothetical protein EVAR_33515_1 [Eumeta japonica]
MEVSHFVNLYDTVEVVHGLLFCPLLKRHYSIVQNSDSTTGGNVLKAILRRDIHAGQGPEVRGLTGARNAVQLSFDLHVKLHYIFIRVLFVILNGFRALCAQMPLHNLRRPRVSHFDHLLEGCTFPAAT